MLSAVCGGMVEKSSKSQTQKLSLQISTGSHPMALALLSFGERTRNICTTGSQRFVRESLGAGSAFALRVTSSSNTQIARSRRQAQQ
jgi:hypothetical protein